MSRSNANDPVVFVTESEIIQAIREAIAARPGGAPGWTPELQVKAERSLRGRMYRLLEGIAYEAQNAVSTALANDRDRAVSELEGISADNDVVRSERDRAIAEIARLNACVAEANAYMAEAALAIERLERIVPSQP